MRLESNEIKRDRLHASFTLPAPKGLAHAADFDAHVKTTSKMGMLYIPVIYLLLKYIVWALCLRAGSED